MTSYHPTHCPTTAETALVAGVCTAVYVDVSVVVSGCVGPRAWLERGHHSDARAIAVVGNCSLPPRRRHAPASLHRLPFPHDTYISPMCVCVGVCCGFATGHEPKAHAPAIRMRLLPRPRRPLLFPLPPCTACLCRLSPTHVVEAVSPASSDGTDRCVCACLYFCACRRERERRERESVRVCARDSVCVVVLRMCVTGC